MPSKKKDKRKKKKKKKKKKIVVAWILITLFYTLVCVPRFRRRIKLLSVE